MLSVVCLLAFPGLRKNTASSGSADVARYFDRTLFYNFHVGVVAVGGKLLLHRLSVRIFESKRQPRNIHIHRYR